MSQKNTRQKRVQWYHKASFLWSIAIAIIVCLTFWPILQHGFFNMDDLPLITRNRVLLNNSLSDLQVIFSKQLWSPYYKPLVYISWMIERDLFGLSAQVLHLNNMLLHALNAVLVFLLFVRLLPVVWPKRSQSLVLLAGFAALIWAIHPFRVESVAWAVERKDVLFGMFYLLACHAWISHCRSQNEWKWLALATLCFALSCLSKSMGITFPATALLLELFIHRASRPRLWDKIPLIVVMLVMLYLYGYFSQEESQNMIDPLRIASASSGFLSDLPSVVQHALIASYRLVLLAAHTLVPLHIAVVYPREIFLDGIGVFICAFPILVLGLIALAFSKRMRYPVFAFTLAWFIITISPVLMGDGVGTNFLSDRYTYLPSIAIVLAIVILIQNICQRFIADRAKSLKATSLGLLLLSGCMFAMTWIQVRVWETNLSLWQQAIDNYPKNWYALFNRAKLTADEDLQQALKDMDLAIAEMPRLPELYFARGTLYMNAQKTAEAIADFDRVLAKEPGHLESRINRANSYRLQKRYQEALADYQEVLTQRPKSSKALNNRGLVFMDLARLDEAARDFDKAIASYPEYPNPYLNRANLRLRPERADYTGAAQDLSTYLQYVPQSHEAFFRRGYAYLRLGQLQLALSDINAALALHDTEGYYYLGRAQVHEQLGNTEAAARDHQKANSLGVK